MRLKSPPLTEVNLIGYWNQYSSQLKNLYPGLNQNIFLKNLEEVHLNRDIKKDLIKGKPFAYILGYEYFYDLKIQVNPYVLIPRKETELILEFLKIKSNSKILDLCSGPGTIGLGLASYNKIPLEITFSDVLPEAIKLAQKNAHYLSHHFHPETVFEFDCSDLGKNLTQKFDYIVCNPPYIPPTKMTSVHSQVTQFEPHLALFIQDYEGFHQKLFQQIFNLLNDSGVFIMENHEDLIETLIPLASSIGFGKIEILKDLTQRSRFIKAVKNG